MNSENNNINLETRRPGVHRKESKRILAIITASLLMLIIWGICALAGSLMKVRKITVSGSSPYTAEEIVTASGISSGDKVSRIDKDAAEKAILQNLSYISEVRVRAGLFGRIRISLRSDTATYYTMIAGEYFSMSDEFRLLGKESNPSSYESGGLIFISLPKIKTAILGDRLAYYDTDSEFVSQLLADLRNAEMFEEVRAVSAETRYDVEITYGRFTIVIGVYKDMASKLSLASQMAKDDVLTAAESAILDVSDPANATIRFK